MSDLVSDIKSRISVYDLISQYVQLKKAGRNWKGLSPFKPEKTASFMVSDEKQIWHCFSTGKGGDVFSFIQEYEGVDFNEALVILAEKAGVEIEKYRKSFKPENKSEKEEMLKAHDYAADFFHSQLFKNNDGKKVIEYLTKRGVTDETIKNFKIGFAPDSYDMLYPFLLKKGIRKSVLLKTGLCSTNNTDSDKIYDKFRARLMFPIAESLGRICGFGGRALKKDQAPKYLNSPESLIYNKSKILYGLSFSKKYIKSENKILLVEGYFDVILPYQEGIKYVVSTSGTALTKDHVNMISRYTDNVLTCFDSDVAGFNATVRSYELLKGKDLRVKTVDAVGGKDPADFVLNDKVAFEKSISEARNFLEFYLDKLMKDKNLDDIEVRKFIIDSFLSFLNLLSPVEKDYYVRFLSLKMKLSETLLYEELSLIKKKELGNYSKSNEKENLYDLKKLSFPEFVIAFLLAFPVYFGRFSEKVFDNFFENDLNIIYNTMYKQYNTSRVELIEWDLDDFDFDEVKKSLSMLILFGEDKYKSLSDSAIEEEFEKLVSKFIVDEQKRKEKSLEKQILEAEQTGDTEKLLKLLKVHQEVLSNKK